MIRRPLCNGLKQQNYRIKTSKPKNDLEHLKSLKTALN